MKHEHIAPCACAGSCAAVLFTKWEGNIGATNDWYVEMYQHIAYRPGLKDRLRVVWAVLRGREPYTHGLVLMENQIVGLRDFLNERTGHA